MKESPPGAMPVEEDMAEKLAIWTYLENKVMEKFPSSRDAPNHPAGLDIVKKGLAIQFWIWNVWKKNTQDVLMQRVVAALGTGDRSLFQKSDGVFRPACQWRGVKCNTRGDIIEIFWKDVFRGNGMLNLAWIPSTLEMFTASNCNLIGGIDMKDFSDIKSLEWLDLSKNKLRGKLNLGQLPPNLRIFHLDHNDFSGHLDLGNLPETLQSASLQHNRLSGPLIFSNLPAHLHTLNLSSNSFSGEIDFGKIPSSLTRLNLAHTQVSGKVQMVSGREIQIEGSNISIFHPFKKEIGTSPVKPSDPLTSGHLHRSAASIAPSLLGMMKGMDDQPLEEMHFKPFDPSDPSVREFQDEDYEPHKKIPAKKMKKQKKAARPISLNDEEYMKILVNATVNNEGSDKQSIVENNQTGRRKDPPKNFKFQNSEEMTSVHGVKSKEKSYKGSVSKPLGKVGAIAREAHRMSFKSNDIDRAWNDIAKSHALHHLSKTGACNERTENELTKKGLECESSMSLTKGNTEKSGKKEDAEKENALEAWKRNIDDTNAEKERMKRKRESEDSPAGMTFEKRMALETNRMESALKASEKVVAQIQDVSKIEVIGSHSPNKSAEKVLENQQENRLDKIYDRRLSEEITSSLRDVESKEKSSWVKCFSKRKWYAAKVVPSARSNQFVDMVQWNGRGEVTPAAKKELSPLEPLDTTTFQPYEVEFRDQGCWVGVYVIREFEKDFVLLHWYKERKSEVHPRSSTRPLTEPIDIVSDDEKNEQLVSNPSSLTVESKKLNDVSTPQEGRKRTNMNNSNDNETHENSMTLTQEFITEKQNEPWVKHRFGSKWHIGKIIKHDSPVVEVQWSGSSRTDSLVESAVSPLLSKCSTEVPYDAEIKDGKDWLKVKILQDFEHDFVLVYRGNGREVEVHPKKKTRIIG